jgi:hypothetical protein
MAIGDPWTQAMGSGTTTRQPSAGVSEQLSFIVKDTTTDEIQLNNGVSGRGILSGPVRTDTDIVDSAQAGAQTYNMAILIDNTNWLVKTGTTDTIFVGGVQVDA